ncbi:MAG: DHHA1 domain-containing protein [bacterium]
MTRRAYQDDAYLREFETTITGIRPVSKGHAILLEATLFYPDAGGQPCDTGWIGSARIETVEELQGADDAEADIVHIAAAAPEFSVGDTVRGRIDWPGRFLNMQQHTGQHILSQAFLKIAEARTVSSRLGLEHSTIDVSRLDLAWEDMARVEQAANRVVYENRRVKIYQAEADSLQGLRAKQEPRRGMLRIVEVEDFDLSPCGGTHCARTGEVGLVKILRWEKVRDTTRVEFVCGGLAEADYFWKNRVIVETAQAFTVKDTAVADLARNLDGSARELRRQVAELKARLAGYLVKDLEAAAETVSGTRLVAAVVEGASAADLREMAAKLTAAPRAVALLAAGGERAHFVFSRSRDLDLDMRQVLAAATAVAGGKGGGRPEVCEGGGKEPGLAAPALEAAAAFARGVLAERGPEG